ncbi:MAG: hypothetical protein IPL23_17995 [Saprospiraceae bacterium]|nr:hypothetical protein [Saprospiraceae bacterium]MBK8636656.1 hypothetical protein [Saprospiraceae bacterium]HMS70088.1 hypothetical protein [Saprospiraceae bacterium]
MTLKQLIKIEDKAKEVWVVSPSLHYDTENKDFSELVSVNLGQMTKYRYIVPATKTVEKNLKSYQKMYNVSDEEVIKNFLILPETEFNPFINEIAIYDASSECIACSAPAMEDANDEVIKFNAETSKAMAKSFKDLWKKYKRVNP